MCCFPGGRTLRPAQLTSAVDEWVEWEASVLRPATFTGATSQALTRLQSCTDSNQYLVGGVFTLADVSKHRMLQATVALPCAGCCVKHS